MHQTRLLPVRLFHENHKVLAKMPGSSNEIRGIPGDFSAKAGHK